MICERRRRKLTDTLHSRLLEQRKLLLRWLYILSCSTEESHSRSSRLPPGVTLTSLLGFAPSTKYLREQVSSAVDTLQRNNFCTWLEVTSARVSALLRGSPFFVWLYFPSRFITVCKQR